MFYHILSGSAARGCSAEDGRQQRQWILFVEIKLRWQKNGSQASLRDNSILLEANMASARAFTQQIRAVAVT
eukprot:1144660-Pelagomonas_calceolata.AAC.13